MITYLVSLQILYNSINIVANLDFSYHCERESTRPVRHLLKLLRNSQISNIQSQLINFIPPNLLHPCVQLVKKHIPLLTASTVASYQSLSGGQYARTWSPDENG
jgi:hypothetical protein